MPMLRSALPAIHELGATPHGQIAALNIRGIVNLFAVKSIDRQTGENRGIERKATNW